ncbi:MAG TPA: sulfatase-like hydrolase/transferase, partial [Vicinamibacteria bacterium]
MSKLRWTIGILTLVLASVGASPAGARERASADVKPLARIAGAAPRNVVFILSDDHRYDAMGFMGHPIVRTPGIDRIAARGVHFRNAFVTT